MFNILATKIIINDLRDSVSIIVGTLIIQGARNLIWGVQVI
jgi:hypothetical protein